MKPSGAEPAASFGGPPVAAAAEPAWRTLLSRGGLVPGDGRILWVHGGDLAAFQVLGGLGPELNSRFARVRLLFTSPDAAARRWLAEQHPGALVLPCPWDLAVSLASFLRTAKPLALLLLGPPVGLPPRILRQARRRGIPVAMVGSQTRVQPRGTPLAEVDRVFPAEAPPAETAEVLAALLTRDRKTERQDRRGFVDSGLGRRLLALRSERIADFESLRLRLGSPETILCLGNGPSSEDPRLRGLAFDCLFRVNWQWRRRGFLARPDMVFTGNARALTELPFARFGFQTIDAERQILARYLQRLRPLHLSYVTLERMPSFLNEIRWAAAPTNGSAMLATAVALQPKRMIIAGIDLFDHPAGSYPGDTATANAYTPRHSREVELRILETALAQYRGEVEIISDVLRAHLAGRG